MKTLSCAIVIGALLLSAVLCQAADDYDEDYVDVNCKYQWGGVVCDCERLKYLMRLPALHGNIREIHVKNCEHFLVPQNSLSDLAQLNGLKFEDIGELDLREYSFNSTRSRPSIRLEIYNSTVPNLPSHLIKGNLEELIIRDSNISKIHVFAFTGFSSDVSAIRIINTTIGEIEAQAFKKLTVLNLEIIDTTFQMNSVSRTFYDCHIQSIVVENSHFTMLNPSTFDAKHVQRLRVFNSTFGVIDGEAFLMDVSDRAIFSNNSISMLHHSAFKGITMNPKTPTTRTQDVYFEFNNNRVDFIHPEGDVSFCPHMKLQVSKFYLKDVRNCEAVGRMSGEQFFSDNSNSIFMRTEEFYDYGSISYLNDRCKTNSNWFMILMIIIASAVLLFLIVLALFCYCRRKRQLDIIMPEPRTYRQTQIIMQVETHGLMKTDF